VFRDAGIVDTCCCLLTYLSLYAMKKPTNTTIKPDPKAKAEQPAATVASETKAIKASPTPKPAAKPKAAVPKPVPKVKAEQPVAVAVTETKAVKPSQTPKSSNKAGAETAELPVSERVGLTAGSIWQYLSENGATSVANLVRDLPEEEKIVQRSIGWLAQEGKITLNTIDTVETIGLSD
jgi:hypothetical protein